MYPKNLMGFGLPGTSYDSKRHYCFIVWGIWEKSKLNYNSLFDRVKNMLINNSPLDIISKEYYNTLRGCSDRAGNCDLQLLIGLQRRLNISSADDINITSMCWLADPMSIPTYTSIPIPSIPNGYNMSQKIDMLIDVSLVVGTSRNNIELQAMDNYLYFAAKGLGISEDDKLKIYRSVMQVGDIIDPYKNHSVFVQSVKMKL